MIRHVPRNSLAAKQRCGESQERAEWNAKAQTACKKTARAQALERQASRGSEITRVARGGP
ncbi:hypothetical protein SSAG_00748 [Streptomyces sp. Mg1]|nr:hypothetical protein SSAG_00748 [Streptomyces sp. Mg1]